MMLEIILKYLKYMGVLIYHVITWILLMFIKLLDYPIFLGILSFFIPGLGQIFAHVHLRGIILFIIGLLFTYLYWIFDFSIYVSIIYFLFKLFVAYDAVKYGIKYKNNVKRIRNNNKRIRNNGYKYY